MATLLVKLTMDFNCPPPLISFMSLALNFLRLSLLADFLRDFFMFLIVSLDHFARGKRGVVTGFENITALDLRHLFFVQLFE